MARQAYCRWILCNSEAPSKVKDRVLVRIELQHASIRFDEILLWGSSFRRAS